MQPACLNDNHNVQYHQRHHCRHHDVTNNTVITLTNVITIITTTTINMIVKDTIMKKGNPWVTTCRFHPKIADSANS